MTASSQRRTPWRSSEGSSTPGNAAGGGNPPLQGSIAVRNRMDTPAAAILKTLLRVNRHGWAKGSVGEQRRRQERRARLIPVDRSVGVDPFLIGALNAAWIAAPGTNSGTHRNAPVVLYLHGGAYALGSILTHRAFLGRFATATRTRVLAIEYRRAPEHPFPAALEDAVAAYRWLISTGVGPTEIVIAGDSAGGGLALATILLLRDAGEALPACAVCLSPWLDLTLSCRSIDSNAKKDPILSRKVLERYAGMHVGACDLNDPLVSPFFADLSGFPPILIHIGSDEILLDEAAAVSNAARAAGVECEFEVWPGMFHVFQMFPLLRQSGAGLDKAARFIASHTRDRPDSRH